MAEQYNKIAIADIGTQLFWWNPTSSYEEATVTSTTFDSLKDTLYTKTGTGTSAVYTKLPSNATYNSNETYYTAVGTFEYALPITAGAEFGGDTESFDAPETDLNFVSKVGGRSTLNDIPYTINYEAKKYQRILDISDNTDENIYMEVEADGSAFVFAGTSGMPTKTPGDVIQITWTIIPSIVVWVDNIASMSTKCKERVQSINTALVDGNEIVIDADSIPAIRQDYYTTKNLSE